MKHFLYFFLSIGLLVFILMLGLFFVSDYEAIKFFYHGILGQLGYYKYLYNPNCVKYGCNFLQDFPGIVIITIVFILIFFVWAIVSKKKNLFKLGIKTYFLITVYNFFGKKIPQKYVDKISNADQNIDKEGFDKGISLGEKKAAKQKSKWFGYGLLFFYFFLALLFLVIPIIVLIKK